jgi:hypothetical protein
MKTTSIKKEANTTGTNWGELIGKHRYLNRGLNLGGGLAGVSDLYNAADNFSGGEGTSKLTGLKNLSDAAGWAGLMPAITNRIGVNARGALGGAAAPGFAINAAQSLGGVAKNLREGDALGAAGNAAVAGFNGWGAYSSGKDFLNSGLGKKTVGFINNAVRSPAAQSMANAGRGTAGLGIAANPSVAGKAMATTTSKVMGKVLPTVAVADMAHQGYQFSQNPTKAMADTRGALENQGVLGRAMYGLANPVNTIATAVNDLGELGKITYENMTAKPYTPPARPAKPYNPEVTQKMQPIQPAANKPVSVAPPAPTPTPSPVKPAPAPVQAQTDPVNPPAPKVKISEFRRNTGILDEKGQVWVNPADKGYVEKLGSSWEEYIALPAATNARTIVEFFAQPNN